MNRPLEPAFSIPNVKAGIAKSAIYPFNLDAVAKHKLIPSSLHESISSTSDSKSSSLYSLVSESPNPPSQPFSLSQSPRQMSQQTTQTIVPPALPPPHTCLWSFWSLTRQTIVPPGLPPPHTVYGPSRALQHRLLFHQLCLLHTPVYGPSGALQHRLLFHQLCLLHTPVYGPSGALQHRLLFHQLCLLHTLFMVLLEPYNTDYCSTSSASSTHCLWYFWSLTTQTIVPPALPPPHTLFMVLLEAYTLKML